MDLTFPEKIRVINILGIWLAYSTGFKSVVGYNE